MVRLYLIAISLIAASFMGVPQPAFAEVEHASVVDSYPVVGTLRPNLITTISAQISGRVQEVLVEAGDSVEKDQVLLKLDPILFVIENKKQLAEVELAQVAYEEAELEFKRMKNLWEKQNGAKPSIPQKQYDDAHAKLRQKKIMLEQARIELEESQEQLKETQIKAPYKGIVVKRWVDPGETVTSNPIVPLFEIIDPSKLILEFSLPQEKLSMIRPGLMIIAKVEGQKEYIEGKIEKVIPQIEEANRCFKCRAIINNDHFLLKAGSYVTAKIQLDPR